MFFARVRRVADTQTCVIVPSELAGTFRCSSLCSCTACNAGNGRQPLMSHPFCPLLLFLAVPRTSRTVQAAAYRMVGERPAAYRMVGER